jgi:two-component system sensor histidine kinase ResE
MVDQHPPQRAGRAPFAGNDPHLRLRDRLPLARTLVLALMGLTLALAVIAALGVGRLYAERQQYEDALARSYELEATAARLEAAGVIEESALLRSDAAARAVRRRAREAFSARAEEALRLAGGDAPSRRLVRRRIIAQRRARRAVAAAASSGPGGASTQPLRRALRRTRAASDGIVARQRSRREQAREQAAAGTRTALLTTAGAGGLGLLGALGLVFALIGSIRRPLEDLVGATQRLAAGERSVRVDPAGPRELRVLDGTFNTMAERLEQAQARIEAEREKLAVTVASLGDGLVVADIDGTVTAANPRALEMAPTLAPGAPTRAIASPLPPLGDALADEVELEHGGRTLSIHAARLDRREGLGVVWTLRDVSERARIDRLKSDFVATASHELRSPLTSIKGFVELLGRSQALGSREREFVDVILDSTDRLVELVNDLLDVARLDAGRMDVHPQLFHLAEVVDEVATLLRPRLVAKEQRLDLDLPPRLPRALADPALVRQILINLVSNAHQYTDAGGRVTVSADRVAGELELAVTDDGRGMSQDDLDHVFDRFVRRADGGGGTGLGLSIVSSLVELQGGSVDVDSRLGEGTRFTVRLPIEPSGSAPEAPAAAMRGRRVLLVGDDRATATELARQLSEREIDVEVVAPDADPLTRLRDGRFDAVALDVSTREGSLGLTGQLRADPQLARTPAVVGLAAGAAEHEVLFGEWRVARPVEPDRLADVLGAALLAGRASVLVIARPAVRARIEPALLRLGVDHEWVTSGAETARACARRRFELALVDAGARDLEAAVSGLELRGRRLEHGVIALTTVEAPGTPAGIDAEAVPVDQAAAAVLRALSEDGGSEPAGAGVQAQRSAAPGAASSIAPRC